MKQFMVTTTIEVYADDKDHALEQALELMIDGQFIPEVQESPTNVLKLLEAFYPGAEFHQRFIKANDLTASEFISDGIRYRAKAFEGIGVVHWWRLGQV